MDAVSVIIPYRQEKNSHELRFALRSIEKHLKGYGDIWLIGDLPDWIRNVRHIPFTDSQDPRQKERNIYQKTILAFEHTDISEQVLHLHDDHYLLADYTALDFPYYTHRSLAEGQRENQGSYRTTLIRTERLLKSMLLGTKDFDCHCPIVYDREKFIEAFSGVEWRDYGIGIKSYYCNYWGIEGVKCEDLKLTGRKLKEMQGRIRGRSSTGCCAWFSTGSSNPIMEQFLAGLFPHRSKYER